MKKLTYLLAVLALTFSSCGGAQEPQVELAKPTQSQINFADWEVGAFFHYDLNVFTGQEHGDGQEPPSKFNPTELDMEQWVRTAKDLGARYACLTARHEGGFCLWPTKTSEYSIKNSPYKDGKGDLVKEFVDACRKYDIVPALYHTGGFDANATLGSNYDGPHELPLDWMTTWGYAMSEAHKKDPSLMKRFIEVQKEQMRELLTNYGPIGFVWSDHWDATDPNGVWRAVTEVAREVQPECVFMGPDTWVPGNETGHVVYPMWNAVNTADGTNNSRPAASKADHSIDNDYGLLETDVLTGHPLGKFWRVRECTTNSGFAYGGWFWHPADVQASYPKHLWEQVDLYYRTVGLGANVIINLPADDRGLIPDDYVAAAKKFGDVIRDHFSNPIAKTGKVIKGDVVELEWKEPKEINTIVTMENIANGQKVAKYNLQAWVDGAWVDVENRNKVIAAKPYSVNPGYETIGHKKIDVIKPVTTTKVRFVCTESIAKPVEIRDFAVYFCKPVEKTYNSEFPYVSGVTTTAESCHGGLKRDVNYSGYDVIVDGKKFEKSLMTCPVGSDKMGFAEFDLKTLKSPVKGITAEVGIEDSVAEKGSCKFIYQVYSDGMWTDIATTPILRGSDKLQTFTAEITPEMELIRLIATDGGDGGGCDHAVWGNAKFIVK